MADLFVDEQATDGNITFSATTDDYKNNIYPPG